MVPKPNFSTYRIGIGAIFTLLPTIVIYLSIPGLPRPQTNVDYTKIPKNVWILYLGSYGSEDVDGNWNHWRQLTSEYSRDYYEPPKSIASNTYPALGLYSSHDESVLRAHCQMIYNAGIDAVILTWWGINTSEPREENANGYTDVTMQKLLKIAPEFGLKVGIQIQPYPNRNSTSIIDDMNYILDKYAINPNFLTVNNRPVIIIYELFTIQDIKLTCGQFKYNPYIVGTAASEQDVASNVENCLDAVFTYFAADRQTWSTNVTGWPHIASELHSRGQGFIPGVAPGHDRGKVDHWNRNERSRESGTYYTYMWQNAIKAKSDTIIINSFNNWVDNSQIEPSVDRPDYRHNAGNWADPKVDDPYFYIHLTKKFVDEYKSSK